MDTSPLSVILRPGFPEVLFLISRQFSAFEEIKHTGLPLEFKLTGTFFAFPGGADILSDTPHGRPGCWVPHGVCKPLDAPLAQTRDRKHVGPGRTPFVEFGHYGLPRLHDELGNLLWKTPPPGEIIGCDVVFFEKWEKVWVDHGRSLRRTIFEDVM